MNTRGPTPMESDALLPLPGSGTGFVERDWKPAFEQAGLLRMEDFLIVRAKPLLKPGLGKRYRAQLELTDSGKKRLVFLKRYEGETLRSLFRRWFEDRERSPIALREVRVANALDKIGISTFKPLAWGWQGDWGTNQKSFVMMSQVPGESIDQWLSGKGFGPGTEGWRRKLRLVEQVAQVSKLLHEKGWFHRDFYLCHIFITDTGADFQPALVDLARMFRPRFLTRRWRIKDLAQLNFSAPGTCFSWSLRLRFFKQYLGVSRLTHAHKTLLRGIVKRSERIARRELRKKLASSR